MILSDYINPLWCDPGVLTTQYKNGNPFPHIVMTDFIKEDLLHDVVKEFPDLSQGSGFIAFNDERQVKLAAKGMRSLSPAAFTLTSFLNSDLFLEYLQTLTSIQEPLISDPYLSGGGYHEIKKGGLLKVHADFNKHPLLELDRRLNLIIYLNKNWNEEWRGGLELFNADMSGPIVEVLPHFNTAVLFSTTSITFHGHPDPLECPDNISRKSLAYYYYSTGRPISEMTFAHSTIFRRRKGESFTYNNFFSFKNLKFIFREICPHIMLRGAKKLFK